MVNLIKNIFWDIFILYKNFLHFNFSKLLNLIVSIIYTLIFSIPLIFLMNIFVEYVVSTWNISGLYENIYYLIEGIIFFIISVSFLYYFVLQTNLNLNYIKGEKLGFLKNHYFNLKLFKNYFKLMILNLIAFIILYIIYQLVFWIVIYSVWGMDKILEFSNFTSIIVWTFGIITFLLFTYLAYIMLLSIIILVDESNWKIFKKSFYYLKKSFKLAKWGLNISKLLFISIVTFVVSLFIYVPLFSSMFLTVDLNNYIEYKVSPESFTENQFYYTQGLESSFWNYNIEELENKLQNSIYFERVMIILFFLIILGLFEMMLVSFYKRELIWNKKDEENSSIELKNKTIEIKKVVKRKVSVKKVDAKASAKKVIAKKVPAKKTVVKPVVKKVTVKKEPTKKIVNKKATVKKVEETSVKKGRGRPRKIEK